MIGAFVEIQDNVRIGNNCRIQSHTFICSLVTIEDNCFIGHGVMFINDRYPPGGNPKKWEKTVVKEGVSIGNNATILPCIIGKNAHIGAGSVLTHDADSYSIYVGNPARKIGDIRYEKE